jgi:hypothetical protein
MHNVPCPDVKLTEGDEVDEQNLVRQWNELEVDHLNKRPHHPVLGEGVPVCGLQLLPRVGALQQRHGAEEAEQVGASEHGLIGEDTRDDLEVGLARDNDLFLEEAEPLDSGRTEHATAVEDHAAGAAEVVVLEALLVDELLSHGVAGREEDAGGDGLGEDWARGQLGLVPVDALVGGTRREDVEQCIPAQHLGRGVVVCEVVCRVSSVRFRKGQWSMVGVLRPSRCELQMSGPAVVRETGIDRTSCLRVECSRESDACRSVVVHTGGVRE